MTSVPEKRTAALGLRIQPELKAALEKAAKDDVRSVSSLIQLILTDWLREHGYLPPQD